MASKSMKTAMIRVSSVNNTEKGLVEYSFDDIKNILIEWSKSAKLTYWCIEHTADDEVSMTHFHIVIKFGNPMPFTNVKVKFPYGDIENARSIKASVQYLIHLNDRSKVQYNWDSVVTNCADMSPYKVMSNTQGEITIQYVLEEIEKGNIREYNQFEKIPIEIWSKYKSRIENGLTYYREKIYMDKNRQINVVFMSGASGTGKTTFAKEYCIKTGKTFCVSSTSNDTMQDYKGEDVLIFDDLRDSDYKFSDLLKILDNHTKSTIQSRYHNKAFIGDTIIITSYKPLSDWYYDVARESKEQLYRRIKTQYHFDNDKIELFEFSSKTHRYEYIGRLPNIIMKHKRTTREFGLDMVAQMGLEIDISDRLCKQMEMDFVQVSDKQKLPWEE